MAADAVPLPPPPGQHQWKFSRVSVTRDGVALVSLCREPVNTMDTAFWAELTALLDELEASFNNKSGNKAAAVTATTADGGGGGGGGFGAPLSSPPSSSPSPSPPIPRIRAAVFSSGLERDVFTAGNDVAELYAPATSRERYKKFWVLQNAFLSRLFSSPLATVAAWRGATPAAGCCLGLACDTRIMSEGRTSSNSSSNGGAPSPPSPPSSFVGLNEVALGIPVPEKWSALLARVVGVARAERMALFAEMLSPREALASGLVDAVVPGGDRRDLENAALAAARAALRLPDGGRVATKLRERSAFAKEWAEFAPGEAIGAWEMLEAPSTVRALGAVIERLAGKKKKKDKNENGSTMSDKSAPQAKL